MPTTFGNVPANQAFVVAGKAGRATLNLGTVTVSDAGVTADSVIFLTAHPSGVCVGTLRVSAINPGTGFTITSSILTDNALVGWLRVEP